MITLYDSDKILHRPDFGYSSLSPKEMQDYADIMWIAYLSYFCKNSDFNPKCLECVDIELNRLHGHFRMAVNGNSKLIDQEMFMEPEEKYFYSNGNYKFLENIQFILNLYFKLGACGNLLYLMRKDPTWHGTFAFFYFIQDSIYGLIRKHMIEQARGKELADLISKIYKSYSDAFIEIGFGAP